MTGVVVHLAWHEGKKHRQRAELGLGLGWWFIVYILSRDSWICGAHGTEWYIRKCNKTSQVLISAKFVFLFVQDMG
ncbi:hypothetical protein K505DRAFT_322401 [Melanomma pulvis-pyrius CBS 109.77]|uniref:Uncharacterized protein n=1 Tax=Melanomma pulvis-pyrius CBS 109.77 TaxID=1314802 RepID=A0A6A6XQ41_9PLEO|nr:hypothetical protein K505DRAFT_322401 [Melanomma pulvis-pyrius CBS 109.77]